MSEKETKDTNRKNSKSKMSKKTKIILGSVLGVLVILVGSLTAVYNHYKNMFFEESDPIVQKEDIEYKEVDGITNVLLIGTDGRTLEEASRSDSIIIASIDNNNKNVKLTSINRDTLVDIPEYGEQKINAAYAFGGEKLLMQTLSDNFGIKLDKYIAVNFWGFESIIDEIDGIEVEVKDYEVDEVNKYIGEATGLRSELLKGPGVQQLNGQQALSYARIRQVGNGGYERDERQRRVLYLVAEKLKEQSLLKWPSLANALNGQVKTNIPVSEALNLAYTIYKMPTLDFKQLQIPQTDLCWGGLYKDKGWVLLIDKEQNGEILKDFIFENKEPNPEEFYVSTWMNKLASLHAEEVRYNQMNGINPEEYEDDKDIIPTIPETEEPEVEEPEIEENTAPTISGATGVTLNVGDSFDPLAGVSAYDAEDGNITSTISVSGFVDTSVAGQYNITYSVVDSEGLSTSVSVVVTVVDNDTPTDSTTPEENE